MARISWLFFLILFGFGLKGKSQLSTVPLVPNSIYITIDLNTGHPTVFWTPPVYDPHYPDPIGYIIYKRITDVLTPNGRYESIDTVGPGVRSYTDISSNGNEKIQSYLLASKGPVRPSQISNLHSSIFITAYYDSCNHKIDLTWTNYQGWGNRIRKYDVYIGNTPNWTTYQHYANLSGTTNHVSILNIIENQDYFFYVEAQKDTMAVGGTPFISKSNLCHKFTDMNPTILSYSPADNAASVIPTENLILTFSENVKQGTAGSITIFNANATIFETIPYNDSRITISGSSVTVNPASTFVNGSMYYINIDATVIRDMTGNAYAGISGNATWSFMIQSANSITDLTCSDVLIYPNPTNGLFKIITPENQRITDACVFDITGKLIEQIEIDEKKVFPFDLSCYTKGVYFIRFQMDGESYVKKLILN